MISLLIITPLSSAKTRNNYLKNFILDNRISDSGGFSNVVGSWYDYEVTSYAFDILDHYDLLKEKVDRPDTGENIAKLISDAITNEFIDLNILYFLLNSLNWINQINTAINSTVKSKIITYLNQTELTTGGFTITNTTSSPNIISTYYGIKSSELIGRPLNYTYRNIIWILDCYNADGGFGGNEIMQSTLFTTYYAALSLSELGSFYNLSTLENILEYTKAHYISTGGYKPDLASDMALLSSTSYCIKLISMIPDATYNSKSSTIRWILNQQNIIDGGFSNPSTEEEIKRSSVICSYYAFNALRELSALSYLDEDIGITEFNWIVLLIVLVVIGVAVALVFYIWKRRQI